MRKTRPKVEVRFVTVEDPPLSYYDTAIGAWSGFVPQLLRYIIDTAQVSGLLDHRIVPTFFAADGGAGGLLPNGSYTGALGELLSGRANATAYALSMSSSYVPVLDLSTPFATTGYSVLTKTVEAPTSAWKFIKPFSAGVWGMVAALVVASAVLLYVVDRASPFGYRRMAPTPHERREMGFPMAMYRVVIALLKMEPHAPEAWSTRAVFLAVIFFILFLVTSFESAYNAIEVASQRTSGDITSIEDLAASRRPFGIVESSLPESWFLSHPSPLVRDMSQHKVLFKGLDAAVNALRAGTVDAVIGNTQNLAYWASVAPCELKFAGEPLSSSYWSVAMPKGAVVPPSAVGPAYANATAPPLWKTIIDRGLAAAEEIGYIDTLIQSYLVSSRGCGLPALVSSSSPGHPTPGSITVISGVRPIISADIYAYKLDNFGGIFIIYAVMLSVGWLFLGVEVVFHSPSPDPIPFVRKINKWLGAEYHFVVEGASDGGGNRASVATDDGRGGYSEGAEGSHAARGTVLSSAGPTESPTRGYRLSMRPVAHGSGGHGRHGHAAAGGAGAATSSNNPVRGALQAAAGDEGLHTLTGINEAAVSEEGEGDDGSINGPPPSRSGRRGSGALDLPPHPHHPHPYNDPDRRRSFGGAPALGTPVKASRSPVHSATRSAADAFDAGEFDALSDVPFDEDAGGSGSEAAGPSRHLDSSVAASDVSDGGEDQPAVRPVSSYRPPSLAAFGRSGGSTMSQSLRLRHGGGDAQMSLFSQSLRSLQQAFGSGGSDSHPRAASTSSAYATSEGVVVSGNDEEAGTAQVRRSNRVSYLLRRATSSDGAQ